MSNPTKQPDRPWGNSSGLPERASCPILNRKAALLRGDPEPMRHDMMLVYLLEARSFWRGRDEELLAAGYEDPDDFWRVLLSKPRSIDSFAVLVTGLLIDPVEKELMFDVRTRREVSPAYFHVRNAIDLADVNAPFFVETSQGRMVRPLEACRWFAASPRYRGFLTPSLLAFLAPAPPASVAKPEPAPPPPDDRIDEAPAPNERPVASTATKAPRRRKPARELDRVQKKIVGLGDAYPGTKTRQQWAKEFATSLPTLDRASANVVKCRQI
jgi:hypothetical protein